MNAEEDLPGTERAALLRGFARRYCWDSTPADAEADSTRVILRVMNLGMWKDGLDIERVFGRQRLVAVLKHASAGALTPRSWSFWHYRLGLRAVDRAPPPMPLRNRVPSPDLIRPEHRTRSGAG